MTKEKITIKINAKWGSDFQQKSASQALELLLKEWQTLYKSTHRTNEITFIVEKQ